MQLAPPPGDGPGDKHSFAIVWYRTSAQDPGAGVGYAWSPLIGADDASLGSAYQQPDPAQVLALTQVSGPPSPAVATQLLVTTAALDIPGTGIVRRGGTAVPAPGGSASTGTTGGPDVADGVALGASSPTTWNLTFSTTESSLWLDLDVDLAGTPGDTVSLFVDGRQRYQAAVVDAGTRRAGSFVILYDVAPGDHVLSVALTGPTPDVAAGPGTVATVSRLRLSSTAAIQRNFTEAETTRLVIALLAAVVLVLVLVVVLIVVLVRRWRRRRRARATPGPTPDPTPAPEPADP